MFLVLEFAMQCLFHQFVYLSAALKISTNFGKLKMVHFSLSKFIMTNYTKFCFYYAFFFIEIYNIFLISFNNWSKITILWKVVWVTFDLVSNMDAPMDDEDAETVSKNSKISAPFEVLHRTINVWSALKFFLP